MSDKSHTLKHGDAEHELTLRHERGKVLGSIDGGEEHELELLEDGPEGTVLRVGGRILRGAAKVARDHVVVCVGGRSFRFERPGPEGSDAAAESSGEVVAPMTGTVVSLSCEVGQTVSAGDPLVTVEAMKMEHRLVAPGEGTVQEIAVAAGDQVDIGQLLVKLDA